MVAILQNNPATSEVLNCRHFLMGFDLDSFCLPYSFFFLPVSALEKKKNRRSNRSDNMFKLKRSKVLCFLPDLAPDYYAEFLEPPSIQVSLLKKLTHGLYEHSKPPFKQVFGVDNK